MKGRPVYRTGRPFAVISVKLKNFILTTGKKLAIIHFVDFQYLMQWYRRGHNEHDWKSCGGHKPPEGSNPSHCATTNPGAATVPGFCHVF